MLMVRLFVFLTLSASLTSSAPVYWYDMEKQLLYTFEDPEFFRYNTFVSDSKNQPVYDITRTKKASAIPRIQITKYLLLDDLRL